MRMLLVKTGWKTTEFWITLGTAAATALSLFGAVRPEDVADVNNAWANLVMAAATLVNSALYIWSRMRVKESALLGKNGDGQSGE